VDVSTVSLALSGHPRIPEATRRRVCEAAERLGYRPDPALASIAASRWQGRRSVAGVVLAFLVDRCKTREPELTLCAQGIRKQAALLGYGVVELTQADYPSPQAFWRVIRSRGIRGVLVGQSRTDYDSGFFNESVAPVVHCGFLRDVPGDVVRPDLRLAVRESCRRILGAHADLTIFLPVERGLSSDQTIWGAAHVRQAVAEEGRIRLVVAEEAATAADYDALEKARPSAVLTINEKHAGEVRKRMGGSAVYSLHNMPPFEAKSGTDLRLEEIGRVAVNLLEMKMRRLPLSSASFKQTLLVEPRWLEPQ